METFKKQLSEDMKEAMRAKDSLRLNTLRSITSAITVAEKNAPGKALNHIDMLSTMAKQRKQSIEAYTNAGNMELADTEAKELAIIESYMPKTMNEAELATALDATIASMGIELTQKEMGKVIAQFRTAYPGQDMGVVSSMIKSRLA